MPDLGYIIVPPAPLEERVRKGSTTGGLIALMPHTKFQSSRTDISGEENVFVSYAKQETPLEPCSHCASGHAEHNLHVHMLQKRSYTFSAFGTVVSDKMIFK